MKNFFRSILILSLLFFIAPLFAYEEQEIVIVVPSYNNREWAERNIASILQQNYKNYEVLYYVDHSDDGSYEYIKLLLELYDKGHRFSLIFNEDRRGALANHWDAVHRCANTVIIVHLDGDDWFAHPDVLKKINEIYASPDVWVTYGQYVEYPAMTLGHCRPVTNEIIEKNLWRYLSLPLPTTHLRTFRASLFKAIALQDLIDKGRFFPTAGDIAFFWPILEMAGKHVRFINDILYVYNTATDLNDFKVRFEQQMYYFKFIRNKQRYHPLERLPEHTNELSDTTADLLIFSYNRPLQLYAFLESLYWYVKNLGKVSVLYRVSNEQYGQAYKEVQQIFPEVNFVQQSSITPQEDFKKYTLECVRVGHSSYVLFAVDDIIVKDYINIAECINAVQKTHAYGFYLRLGKNINYCYMAQQAQKTPTLIPIAQNIYAWQFKDGSHDWRYPNSVDMTLYRKDTVINALESLEYTNPSNLEGNWFIPTYVNYVNVGLCYAASKIVNIPLNVVQTERDNANMHIETQYLLQLFMNGLKIDCAPLHQIINQSPHEEYELTFTAR